MADDAILRRDVRMLGDMLGAALKELSGPEALDLVEEVRRLALARRAGDAEAESKLAERIAGFNEQQARVVARAFTVFFDLANLAEDRHRVRVLREREQQTFPLPRSESIGDAIGRLKATGLGPGAVQALLDRLRIELVFTAHPTEAKRRSIRSKFKRLREYLRELDRADLLEREKDRLTVRLRAELAGLWQTDFLRLWRPTVLQEVERGLSFAPTLWEVIPLIMGDLRRALAAHYPDFTFRAPPFLRFGSWIGGDRDGNPYVTTEVTAETFKWLRGAALDFHLTRCKDLSRPLSVSERRTEIGQSVREAVVKATQRWPSLEDRLRSISKYEVYRRWLAVIQWRLEETRAAPAWEDAPARAYAGAAELESDLILIQDSLRAHHGAILAEGELQDWIDQVRVFGFHLARLEIRQESGRYRTAMTEIFQKLGFHENYQDLPEAEKQAVLSRTMGEPADLLAEELTPETRDVLALFRLLALVGRTFGSEAIGGHVISLTRAPSDLLVPLWLWQWARRKYQGTHIDTGLPIIPLFETLADLEQAPVTLEALLSHSVFAEQVRKQGQSQVVMVGYSDSTKDAGYLAACWALHRAQTELTKVAKRFGARLIFFHGRGGSLGRGGGPAARAILSLPPEAVAGRLRMTEQGEVLAERYDDIAKAHRQLEQVTWATLLVTATPPAPPLPEWRDIMDKLAAHAYSVYRELVDDPEFLEYFAAATPIDEIENLPIGSRPARRRGKRTLADLRAIPWVFAWTQSRHLVPAWHGLGGAIDRTLTEVPDLGGRLKDMYKGWPLFTALIDNAALAIAKADLAIAKRYADLVQNHKVGERMGNVIHAEFERSRRHVLQILGTAELLEQAPWLDRSIQFRNPYVDPLNLIQIELIKRLRKKQAAGETSGPEPLRDLVRLTIQGIASGMRTTG